MDERARNQNAHRRRDRLEQQHNSLGREPDCSRPGLDRPREHAAFQPARDMLEALAVTLQSFNMSLRFGHCGPFKQADRAPWRRVGGKNLAPIRRSAPQSWGLRSTHPLNLGEFGILQRPKPETSWSRLKKC